MSDFENSHQYSGKKHNMDGWWEEKSLSEKILLGIGFGILGIGLMALCGWVLMLLWNWLMPDIFGLKLITYWQAWGLLLLSSILFKRMGPSNHSGRNEKKRKQKLRSFIHNIEGVDQPGSTES